MKTDEVGAGKTDGTGTGAAASSTGTDWAKAQPHPNRQTATALPVIDGTVIYKMNTFGPVVTRLKRAIARGNLFDSAASGW